MTGAMNLTPAHWRRDRLKNVVVVNRSALPETTDPDFVFRYIDIGNVDGDGRLGDAEHLTFADAPSRARRRVSRGDSIVSTVRTYLRAIAYIDENSDDIVVSTGFATMTPTAEIDSRFLFWWLRSTPFIEEVVARSVGVSYPAVNASDVGDIAVALPPPAEQRLIAQLLDVETTRIDDLIAEQRHLVTQLNQRLSNARQHLLLGADGSGQVGWQFARLKRFVHVARGRFTHRPRNDPAFYDGPYPFVQTGDIANAANGTIVDYTQTLNEAGLAVSRLANAGTIVMAIAANIGDVARLGFDSCFPDSVVALTPGPAVDEDYLLELIRALKTELVGSSTLNTQLNINVDRIGDVFIPVPPLTTQLELVRQLNLMRGHLAAVSSEADHQIALLRDRRSALITAAVAAGLGAAKTVA
jgi:type I restriction enzyme S subunit